MLPDETRRPVPNRTDETAGENKRGTFPSTHWTHILKARSCDEPTRQLALEELLAAYWKPIYCHIRCKGYTTDEAKDLTQGFFSEIVLGRGVIERADYKRGRFRTFLLRCLNRYLTDVFRTERTKRRMPAGGLVCLETVNWAKAPEPVRHTTALEAFDYAWACSLLDKVLAELEAKCREKGTVTQWELFRAKVMEPIRNDVDPPSLTRVCEKYGVPDKATASNMIFSVKRQFRALLRRHVRELVDSDAEVDEEIRELIAIFSKTAAISPPD
jgi:DNA-directed RNA polymerase specialized sigma24 family protein